MLECALVFHRRGPSEVNILQAHQHVPPTQQRIDEIFVVPVCSIFAPTKDAYLEFLKDAGALDRAMQVVAAANLKHSRAAELTRRTVRAIFTEAEVQALAPQIDSLSL